MPPPMRHSPCDAESKGITAALRLHVAFITVCNYMRVTSGQMLICLLVSSVSTISQAIKQGVAFALLAPLPAPWRPTTVRDGVSEIGFWAKSACGFHFHLVKK